MRKAILMLFLLLPTVNCFPKKELESDVLNPTDVEFSESTNKAFLRMTTIVEQRTEFGRMVLLLCKKNCPRLRSQIPQWVRDINEEKQYTGQEVIGYHYHTYKQPLPFLNASGSDRFPMLIYIIAQTPYVYLGNVTSRQAVSMWIIGLDRISIVQPKDGQDLDDLLSGSGNCSEKYLVLISDESRCPIDHWANIARASTMQSDVVAVYLAAPLSSYMRVILYKRLPYLDETLCRQMFMISQHSYSMAFETYIPRLVKALIDVLIPAQDSCASLDETMWNPIQEPLTELQLIYYSGESDLVALEHNQSYILVGLTGGIAVIALAMSIFWGLNGSAFAK